MFNEAHLDCYVYDILIYLRHLLFASDTGFAITFFIFLNEDWLWYFFKNNVFIFSSFTFAFIILFLIIQKKHQHQQIILINSFSTHSPTRGEHFSACTFSLHLSWFVYKCVSFPHASVFNAYINHMAKPYAWCNRMRSHDLFPWCQSVALCKWEHEAEACPLFCIHCHAASCIVKWVHLALYLHFYKVHISMVSKHSGRK